MISRRHLLLALPLAACNRRPGAGYPGFAFVATTETPSVAAVDLLSFSVRNRVELASPPSDLIAHPNPAKQLIYALTPGSQSIVEIDSHAHTRTRVLKLPGEPVTAIAHASTASLWCLLRGAPQLTPVDPVSFRPGKSVVLPAAPIAFDISSRDPLACVTLEDGSVVFVDLAARRAFTPVPIGQTLGPVNFRSDGKLVVIAERTNRQLTVLDVPSRRLITQLPLALSPDRFCVDPTGGQLFITGEGRDAVAIAYPYRTEIAQTSLTGRKPGAMAVSSSPDFLFVANPQAGSVTIFDISTQRVVAVVGVGIDPGALAVTPDQQYALVLNRASGDIAVIRIAAITPGKAKSAPLFTMIPVGTRPAACLIVPA